MGLKMENAFKIVLSFKVGALIAKLIVLFKFSI